MFKYIHKADIKIKADEITLDFVENDFYFLLKNKDLMFELAVQFNRICSETPQDENPYVFDKSKAQRLRMVKAEYHRVIAKLIDLSYEAYVRPLPVKIYWKLINMGKEAEFKKFSMRYLKDYDLLNLQDKSKTFKNIHNDEALKSYKPK
jgi:hypothetical protein